MSRHLPKGGGLLGATARALILGRPVCPHCGNRDLASMEEKEIDSEDSDFTLLCMARVEPGEDAHGGDADDLAASSDGTVPCGMQWCPNERRDVG